MEATEPRAVYEARLRQRRGQLADHDGRYRRIAYARLATAGLLAFMVWLVLWAGLLSPWWMGVPVIVFFWLMTIHSRIEDRRRRIARAIAFYEHGIGRIEDRWIGTGQTGDAFADPKHLYATDLDLFGRGSLFELLSTARTKSGEETLARWLCRPASPEEIRDRQDAVRELRSRVDLREDMASLGPDLYSSIHLDRLRAWADAPGEFEGSWIQPLATASSVLVLGALGYVFWSATTWPYYTLLLGQLILFLGLRKRVERVLSSVELPLRELELVSRLVLRLEAEEFACARLEGLRSLFGRSPAPASTRIRELVRHVERYRSLKNASGPMTIVILFLIALIVPVSLVLLVPLRTAMAVDRWRRAHGPEVGGWILAIGEIEALMALSGYAYEHPSDPFPELVVGETMLAGEALAHPLLPGSASVPNSIRLDGTQQLVVVSGSNMSGKSTLLRTVGVNAVLALAGAPIRARALRISPVAIGATLRIQDSLQAGTSRFYTEIIRIRDIMALTRGPLPALFLLDEILHGTNSHDRALGAAGIMRGLIDSGAIGIATTHDLALADVANALGDRAINVHFEDRMEGGRMIFDYRMKPGIIEKSNALELMRSIGLDV